MKFLNEDAVTILKWVITILITGFIAQFGKKLANFIIDRTRKRKSLPAAANNKNKEIIDTHGHDEDSSPGANQEELLKAQKKIEKEKQKQIKKMAKAQEKAAKKQKKE